MEIFWAVVLFIIAGIVVIKGADFFVDAASWTSDVTGIPKVVIGATVVAIATSAPELFVSLIAAAKGYNDMSVGNVVGSLIANIGIGLSLIVICRPGKNTDKLFAARGIIMIVSTVVLFLFCLTGAITVWHGIILMLIYAFFTFINIKYDKPEAAESKAGDETAAANDNTATSASEEVKEKTETSAPAKHSAKKPTNKKEIIINLLKFAGGAAAIIFGSDLIVNNAKIIASALGMSEMFIGLTIVAVGTSLPEIVTSIAAIVKKENNLGIGNIVGSNVFDATFILAAASFITGGSLAVTNQTTYIDIPFALLLMLITVIPTAIRKKVYRWQGIALAALYVGYIVYLGIAVA